MKNNWRKRVTNSKQYGIIYFKDLLQIDETFGDNKEVDYKKEFFLTVAEWSAGRR